jgi:hypothetical protein
VVARLRKFPGGNEAGNMAAFSQTSRGFGVWFGAFFPNDKEIRENTL